jgi:hypothetical protein
MPPQRRPYLGALCPSTLMRADMLVCASIIAQPTESQGNKNFLSRNMHGNYAGFARSVVAIADFFARQARAGSRYGGDNGDRLRCRTGGRNPAENLRLLWSIDHDGYPVEGSGARSIRPGMLPPTTTACGSPWPIWRPEPGDWRRLTSASLAANPHASRTRRSDRPGLSGLEPPVGVTS